jgi:hypothetical protein
VSRSRVWRCALLQGHTAQIVGGRTAQRGQRLAERLPRGLGLLVAWQVDRRAGARPDGLLVRPHVGLGRRDRDVARPAQLGDRPLGLGRATAPSRAIRPCWPGTRRRGPSRSSQRSALAPHRPRPAGRPRRSRRRRGRRRGAPATRTPRRVRRTGRPPHSSIVGPRCPSRFMSRMPMRLRASWNDAFSIASQTDPSGHFRVAHQHPHAAGEVIEPHGERHAEGDGQSLAERSRGDVHPRHVRQRHGVSLHGRAERSEREQLRVVDRADRLHHREEQRRGVALRQNEAVVSQVSRGPRRRTADGPRTGPRPSGRRTATTSDGPTRPPSSTGCCPRRNCAASSFHSCVLSMPHSPPRGVFLADTLPQP